MMGCNSSHFTRITEHNCRPGISIKTVHVKYSDEDGDDEHRETETSQNDNAEEDILNNREVYIFLIMTMLFCLNANSPQTMLTNKSKNNIFQGFAD